MPEPSRRRERGEGKSTERTAGHEAGSGRPSLPRPFTDPAPLPRSAADVEPPPAELWPIVDAGLSALSVAVSPGARAALDAQLRLLLVWNKHVNLTALRAPEQLARGHLLDSLSALPLLRRLRESRGAAGLAILDVGSGAGYPGLPLAVALPARRCALVDSVHKKQAFLEVAAAAAAEALHEHGEDAPEFAALAERAEDLSDEPDQREGWDVVVARAVGSLAEVAELGLPLLRIGGHLVAWKRETEPAGLRGEIQAAQRVIQACGGAPARVSAPDRSGAAGLADHRLVTVRKVRPTPDRYPRPAAERRRAALLR